MKKAVVLTGLSLALMCSLPAFAGAQQDKMKGCAAEAKSLGKTGEAYRPFMSQCLKKDYELKTAEGKAAVNGTAPAKDAKETAKKTADKPSDKASAKTDSKNAATKTDATKTDAKAADTKTVDAKADKNAKKTDAAPAQQDKMKTCNAEAKTKNLAGEERKKFMSTCLKA